MTEGLDTCFLERRRFPRYPCTGQVEILQSERCWGWGRAVEISCGGCYIETMHPLPVNTETQLRLSIADTPLDICAVVVFCDPLVGMGMAFVLDSREQWNKLSQLVERITTKDFSPTGRAGGSPEKGVCHMQSALQHLRQAREELQEAIRYSENAYARALHFTENAIGEVKNILKPGRIAEIPVPPFVESRLGVEGGDKHRGLSAHPNAG